MGFYDDMADMASDLLQEFDQGGLVLMRQVAGNGPPHNPGPTTWVDEPIAGVAEGVTGEHLKDSLIQSSDLAVTMPGHAHPAMTDRVKSAGQEYTIVKITPIPAAGTPAAYEVIIRR